MAWTERYVRTDAAGGGDGTTDTNSGGTGAFTLAEAITHSTTNTGIRYNVKAGTYANTTTTLTFSGAGSATAPNWWRGFNTTIGDCDSDRTLTRPLITFTTGQFAISGAQQTFSSLDITSQCTTTGGAVNITARPVRLYNVSIDNTAANAASRAITFNTGSNDCSAVACYFKATSSATCVQMSTSSYLLGCTIDGGNVGLSASTLTAIAWCVIKSTNSHGVSTSQALIANNCSFYGAAVASIDGIRVSSGTVAIFIANCIFSEYGGYGVNQSSGTNGNYALLLNNAYYNCTGGQTNGISEAFQVGAVSLSGDPFVNKSSGDFDLNGTGGGAKEAGFPGQFVGLTSTQGYVSIGASIPQGSSVAGGIFNLGGFAGGFDG